MTIYIQRIVKAEITANNAIITPAQMQIQLDLARAIDEAGDNKSGIDRLELKMDKLLDAVLARQSP